MTIQNVQTSMPNDIEEHGEKQKSTELEQSVNKH